jgi:hypothetical protein
MRVMTEEKKKLMTKKKKENLSGKFENDEVAILGNDPNQMRDLRIDPETGQPFKAFRNELKVTTSSHRNFSPKQELMLGIGLFTVVVILWFMYIVALGF